MQTITMSPPLHVELEPGVSGSSDPKKHLSVKIDSWVVVSNIFYFHPYLGKIPILTNIVQMG